MSYEQAMKHSHNHRKDRFVQQCSGYAGNGESEPPMPEEKRRQLELETFARLKELPAEAYPIYIARSGSYYWHEATEQHLFASRIDSIEELEKFEREYL